MGAENLRSPWAGAAIAAVATALLTGLMAPFRDEIGLLNEGFLFLLLTLVVASFWGRNTGIFAALITNLSLNFVFIEPLHTFGVRDPKNIAALLIFLTVSLVGGSLLSAARHAAGQARRQQAETEVALRLSRAMSGQTEPDEALRVLCTEVVRAFDAPGAAVLTRSEGRWSVLASAGGETAGRAPESDERLAAEKAASEGAIQSFGQTGLSRSRARIVFPPGRRTVYERSFVLVPLQLGGRSMGVLRLDGPIGDTPFRQQPAQLLSVVASEAALALQRVELAHEAAHAQALREADEMKNALMASISHDLKTPLAGIKAAISSLLEKGIGWSESDTDAFHRAIDGQADRLDRVISNILDLNRIEAGALTPDESEVPLDDLLANALSATALQTQGRNVSIDAADGISLVTDASLLLQAVINLVENAAKYSKPGGAIHLRAVRQRDHVEVSVADEGPGIAPEDLQHVFDRFFRAGEHNQRVKGSGLGLTIVRSFIELCGGDVLVESSSAGTRFVIRLPAATPTRAAV